MRIPSVPISWGELIDKITILEIKQQRILAPMPARNVKNELQLLAKTAELVLKTNLAAQKLKKQLFDINLKLWEIEDKIRRKEADGAFDNEFISLARSIYKTNDQRASIKRDLNVLLGSALFEEKLYLTH